MILIIEIAAGIGLFYCIREFIRDICAPRIQIVSYPDSGPTPVQILHAREMAAMARLEKELDAKDPKWRSLVTHYRND